MGSSSGSKFDTIGEHDVDAPKNIFFFGTTSLHGDPEEIEQFKHKGSFGVKQLEAGRNLLHKPIHDILIRFQLPYLLEIHRRKLHFLLFVVFEMYLKEAVKQLCSSISTEEN